MPGTTPPGPITALSQWVRSSQIQNCGSLRLPISNRCDGGHHGLDCLTGFFPGLVLQRSRGFHEFWIPNFRSRFRSGKPRAEVAAFYSPLSAASQRARHPAGTEKVGVRHRILTDRNGIQSSVGPRRRWRVISTERVLSPTQTDPSCTVICRVMVRSTRAARFWLWAAGICQTVRLRRRVSRFSRSFHQACALEWKV